MFEATERISIAAAPERVWAVVADVGSHPGLAGSGEVQAVRMTDPLVVGATFEGDVVVGGVRSFTSRNILEVVNPLRELSWVSYPPLQEGESADNQIEVHWTFRLTDVGGATEVEHRFWAPPPKANPEEWIAFMERINRVATVRDGMCRTLENLKAVAESA